MKMSSSSWKLASALLLVVVLAATVIPIVMAADSIFDGPHDVAEFVDSRIEKSQIMVFSKLYCPFCKKTKALLNELLEQDKFSGIQMNVLELDRFPDGGAAETSVQEYLLKKTGQRTVPNIFIGSKHIGGNSDLQELHASGKLEPMLEALLSEKKSHDEL